MSWAFLYNTVWVAFAVKLWQMIKSYTDYDNSIDPVEKHELDYIELFTVMAIAYNLIIHVVIVPINTIIIVKEFSMEFYQFLGVGDIVGSDKDDVSLGFHEVWEFCLAFLELFNPWWWFSDDPWIYE